MPTFGLTTPFGDTTQDVSADYKQVSKYTLSEAGLVSSLSVYLARQADGSQSLRAVIYADSAGAPGALRALSDEVTVTWPTDSTGFKVFTLPSAVALLAGDYWLGFHAGATSGTTFYDKTIVSGNRKYNADTYVGGTTDPFGTVDGTDNLQITVFATYSVGGDVVAGYKRLYGPAQLTGSAADLYTCPASTKTRILHIHASNPSGSPVDVNLSIGADAAATRIWDDNAVRADGTKDDYTDYTLAAGEKIQGWAGSAATVNLTITGIEYPA